MKKRLLLTVVLTLVVCALTWRPNHAAAKDELGIGSVAPPLDIEHWLQDGNGFFEPVTKFKDGKVYVVEFWATWCGPCIISMPHLAELQQQYRGQGVQIISVSDETVDEVKDLMSKEHPEAGKTFEEITSAWSVTTDPDRSVHTDYMEAANQNGIPTAFIVGKQGLIEWIGHPSEMDEPLEAVVNDSWDREKFKEEMKLQQEFQENIEKMSMLAGAGKFDEAIKLAETQIKTTKNDAMREQWVAVRNSLKLSAGKIDEEVIAYYREQMGQMKGDAMSLGRFGYSLYGAVQQGAEIGPLADDAITAIEAEVEGAEEDLKPMLYNAIALLNDAVGKTEQAIKAQQSAIDAADDRQKRRLMPLLEELKEKAGQSDKKDAAEKDEAAEKEEAAE